METCPMCHKEKPRGFMRTCNVCSMCVCTDCAIDIGWFYTARENDGTCAACYKEEDFPEEDALTLGDYDQEHCKECGLATDDLQNGLCVGCCESFEAADKFETDIIPNRWN